MEWTRRRVVVGGTGATLVALAGCLGEDGGSDGENGSSDDEDGSSDDEGSTANEADDRDADAVLEEADLDDYTGRDEVEIAVDPDGGFDPETLEIGTDTLVNWVWEGESTEVYPIDIPEECFWDEEVDEETVEAQSAGDSFDRLFWADGAYLYGSRADGEGFTGAFRVVESDDGDGANENESDDTDE